jgi:uncharacterized Zn-binding protein involved in type VI secretion
VTHAVFANMREIAGKGDMNKSIARFPDVCLSPPSPPAGPIPVPYPDTSFSSDLKEGSDTVLLGGKPAALAQQSYYKPSTLGNEAATRSFGASVVTHQITGKTYFQAWSMDVKIEGKAVCRHLDITTSNHGSSPPATPPGPSASSLIPQGLSPADQVLAEECEKIHKDYEVIKTEQAGYASQIKPIKNRIFNNRGLASDINDIKDLISKQIAALERLKVKRREYIDKGCDKIEWKNKKYATESERKAHHESAVADLEKQIANQKDVLSRL